MFVLGLGSCGGGTDSGGTNAGVRPRLNVTLSATGHHPAAGAPWPIVIHASGANGRPLRAEVRYQFLFAGSVVARRAHYRFRGTLHDTIRWPARSAGIPLTFQAVVSTPLGTRKLNYRVQVTR